MTKVFITGGAGFIGSHITKELTQKKYEVVIYDAFINYHNTEKYKKALRQRQEMLQEVKIVNGDIRSKQKLRQSIKKTSPDTIIHLAAQPNANLAQKFQKETVQTNINGTKNILEIIKKMKNTHFILTSSSMVFGDFVYEPADEEHSTNPICLYGATKLAGEIITKAYAKQYGIRYTIIRPSAVYGPTDANQRVTQIFIQNALQKKPLTLHNHGTARLDFTHVTDLVQGYILALENKKAINETFNMTKGQGRSIKELAQIIQKNIPNTKIENKPTPKNQKRPKRGTLNISKAKKLLGYTPKCTLEKGIKEYIQFIKKTE